MLAPFKPPCGNGAKENEAATIPSKSSSNGTLRDVWLLYVTSMPSTIAGTVGGTKYIRGSECLDGGMTKSADGGVILGKNVQRTA